MVTYTGVADVNGDFTVPFSSNYTSGQKITVTSEKDSATKSIELYAPSALSGGGAIQVSGSWDAFPNNIGIVTIDITSISPSAFWCIDTNIGFSNATGLVLLNTTSIGYSAFYNWKKIETLSLPDSLISIGSTAFYSCILLKELVIPNSTNSIGAGAFAYCVEILKLTLGISLSTIGGSAFINLISCNEINCLSTTPPTITSNTFEGLNQTCVIKVPSASLSAYQTAENWSVFASRMVGI